MVLTDTEFCTIIPKITSRYALMRFRNIMDRHNHPPGITRRIMAGLLGAGALALLAGCTNDTPTERGPAKTTAHTLPTSPEVTGVIPEQTSETPLSFDPDKALEGDPQNIDEYLRGVYRTKAMEFFYEEAYAAARQFLESLDAKHVNAGEGFFSTKWEECGIFVSDRDYPKNYPKNDDVRRPMDTGIITVGIPGQPAASLAIVYKYGRPVVGTTLTYWNGNGWGGGGTAVKPEEYINGDGIKPAQSPEEAAKTDARVVEAITKTLLVDPEKVATGCR